VVSELKELLPYGEATKHGSKSARIRHRKGCATREEGKNTERGRTSQAKKKRENQDLNYLRPIVGTHNNKKQKCY